VQQGARDQKRLYSLDVLRGLASLGVVPVHWRYLFVLTGSPSVEHSLLPFWSALSPLYLKGWVSVDLFFALSGFVFFWLYSEAVSKRQVSAWRFAWLRFSRLYPLHILTLILVAAPLVLLSNLKGVFASHTDLKHLVLNLLFVSSWGAESGYSFNLPIWSVSVEAFLYLLFFIFCRLLPVRLWSVLAMWLVGFILLRGLHLPLGRGVASFFLGGCAYLVYQRILLSGTVDKHLGYLLPLLIAGWAIVLAWFSADFRHTWISFEDVNFFWRAGSADRFAAKAMLFPLTILVLALLETKNRAFGKRFSWLGDISYSTYLLHFPLIAWTALVFTLWKVDTKLFFSPWFMVAFFAVLITLSVLSHRYFEVPIQVWLRRRGQNVRLPLIGSTSAGGGFAIQPNSSAK